MPKVCKSHFPDVSDLDAPPKVSSRGPAVPQGTGALRGALLICPNPPRPPPLPCLSYLLMLRTCAHHCIVESHVVFLLHVV